MWSHYVQQMIIFFVGVSIYSFQDILCDKFNSCSFKRVRKPLLNKLGLSAFLIFKRNYNRIGYKQKRKPKVNNNVSDFAHIWYLSNFSKIKKSIFVRLPNFPPI